MRFLLIYIVFSLGCQESKEPTAEEIQTAPRSTPPVELDNVQASAEKSERKEIYSQLTNLSSHIRDTQVYKLHQQGFYGKGLRIAVFDNGFARLEDAKGKSLPPQSIIEPYPKNEPLTDDHGTRMAEIVYSMATGCSSYCPDKSGPEILLYNTNGFSNFKHAIKSAIERRVDLILYAQVWQYGGNFDGKGFINSEVDKAINAGILWINASGNFANTVFHTKVETTVRGFVKLQNQTDKLDFTVAGNGSPIKIVASWGDYADHEFAQTDIDFDLLLLDAQKKVIGESKLAQITTNDRSRKNSRYPREILFAKLNSGLYHLQLKQQSRNRLPKDLSLRISIDGEGTKIGATTRKKSLMIPADNPRVLSVGAIDFSGSSYEENENGEMRPDILSSSVIQFSDGYEVRSTSTAAAIVAGSLLPAFEKRSYESREELIERLSSNKTLKFTVLARAPRPPGGGQMDQSQFNNSELGGFPNRNIPNTNPLDPGHSGQQPIDQNRSFPDRGNPYELDTPRNGERTPWNKLPRDGNRTQNPQNLFPNDPQLEYPPGARRPGNQIDRGQNDNWIPPQDDPYFGRQRPGSLPPESRRRSESRPQQPHRYGDLPPFRAVN